MRDHWHDAAAPKRMRARAESVLGPAPSAELVGKLPAELVDAYGTLCDPMQRYDVGSVCYYAGIEPFGYTAAKTLAGVQRWDLVRGALRGLNPEGRVYSARALSEAKQLSPDDRRVVRTLRRLDVPISSCSGCFVTKQRAADRIADPGD